MARVLILWTGPDPFSAEEAEAWALGEARRLLTLRAVERAELTRLASASEHHPRGWDWLLELHLAADAHCPDCADAGPCAQWLADLRLLGLQPTVLVADRGIVLPAMAR
jgi:hypothetical protein